MGAHLSYDVLGHLTRGDLSRSREERVRRHLDDCSDCRTLAGQLRDDEQFAAEIRAAVRDPAGATSEEGEEPVVLPRIDGVEILREIRRGSQGVVYQARHNESGALLAVKTLHGGAAAGTRPRRRFEREISLATQLDHPGIIAPLDSGSTEGALYYTMPFVSGQRLDKHLEAAQPGRSEALRIALELATAVGHAHDRGVVHRDLKPANVLVDDQGAVRVLDFGLARGPFGQDSALTDSGVFVGTLAYASPEQTDPHLGPVDERSDVYALGILLHEILAGSPPYPVSGSTTSVVRQIRTAKPKSLALIAQKYGSGVAAVVSRALSKKRTRRYADASAVADDLAVAVDGGRTSAARHNAMRLVARSLAAGLVVTLVAVVATRSPPGDSEAGPFATKTSASTSETQSDSIFDAAFSTVARPLKDRMGADLRVADLKDAIRQRVGPLDNSVDAIAEVHHAVGDTYLDWMMVPEAERHLREALRRYEERGVTESLRGARCLEALARAIASGGGPEAIDRAEQALSIRRTQLVEGDSRLADGYLALAVAQYLRHPTPLPDEALKNFDAALALLRSETESATPRPDQADAIAHVLYERARCLWFFKPRSEGAAAFLEVLDMRQGREAARTDPPWMMALCLDLASFHASVGEFEQAHQWVEEAITLTEHWAGPSRLPKVLRASARIHQNQNHLDVAEHLHREALARELRTRARETGDEKRLRGLATRIVSGSHEALVEGFKEIIGCCGEGSYELTQWILDVARLMRAQYEDEVAAQLLTEGLRINCRLFQGACPFRLDTQQELSEVLYDTDQLDEAISVLEQARQSWGQTNRPAPGRVEVVEALLKRCLDELDDDATNDGTKTGARQP